MQLIMNRSLMKKILLILSFIGVYTLTYSQEAKSNDKHESLSKPEATDEPTIYTIVEEMPKFPGGDAGLYDFLVKNIRYPEKARKKRQEDKVLVRFVVDAKGNVSNIQIAKGEYDLLNKEAKRVVSILPKFTPGKQDGEPVNVWFVLPIVFKLTDPKDTRN